MARFCRSLVLAILFAQFCAQGALGLTPDGRLSQDAKQALRSVDINAGEINAADRLDISLGRSFKILLPLVKLQAADDPANGPIPNVDMDTLFRVFREDPLKNKNLPKIQVADLPPLLVEALKKARLLSGSTTALTAIQFAKLLNKASKVLQLKNKLSQSQLRDFFKGLDGAIEKLALSYKRAIKPEKVAPATPPPSKKKIAASGEAQPHAPRADSIQPQSSPQVIYVPQGSATAGRPDKVLTH